MAAITKSFTTIADSAVDPDSPLTTSLITALRDNDIHLREWLGASFTAGAVQDHDHDGANSALIEVGPNFVRNASFEGGAASWTFTDYSGGSHAVSTSAHQHGDSSITFTSTSTVNGGGDAIMNAYIPCGGGDELPWRVWAWASTANVSARVQAVWYDNTQAQISTTNLVDLTNTPTSATRYAGAVAVPSSARFVRLQLIGGVPGAGSATGTIRFDGMLLTEAGQISASLILPAAVGQGQLKLATGVNTTTGQTEVALAGGAYGFSPGIRGSDTPTTGRMGAGSTGTVTVMSASSTIAYVYTRYISSSSAIASAGLQQIYVQASPPYDLGDGAIPLFLFAAVDANGLAVHTYCAPDPPWANNGPTNVRADFYAGGKSYQRRRQIPLPKAMLLGTDEQRAAYLQAVHEAPVVDVEITQALKQADMQLIPHPFVRGLDGASAITLLDTRRMEALAALHELGECVGDLLHRDYLRLDNTPLQSPAPPGVQMLRPKWRDSRA